MMTFVGIAVLLVLVALAIALRPLWRAARGTALALLVLVPMLVAALYAYKGNPEAINVQPLSKAEQIQQAQAELAQITAKDPDNFEAWVLLGRTRMGLQQYPQAAEAFARALALAPDEPNVMVEAAEAQMRSSDDRRFPPVCTTPCWAASPQISAATSWPPRQASPSARPWPAPRDPDWRCWAPCTRSTP